MMSLRPLRHFWSFLGHSDPPKDALSVDDRAIVRQVRAGFPPVPPGAIVTTQRACIDRLLEVLDRAAPDPEIGS